MKTVNLTLTDADCLNMRMALNTASIHWGEKASDYRKAGNDQEAATCERIRTEFHQLWDAVNVAQEAAPDTAPRGAYADKCGYVGCSFCDADNA